MIGIDLINMYLLVLFFMLVFNFGCHITDDKDE